MRVEGVSCFCLAALFHYAWSSRGATYPRTVLEHTTVEGSKGLTIPCLALQASTRLPQRCCRGTLATSVTVPMLSVWWSENAAWLTMPWFSSKISSPMLAWLAVRSLPATLALADVEVSQGKGRYNRRLLLWSSTADNLEFPFSPVVGWVVEWKGGPTKTKLKWKKLGSGGPCVPCCCGHTFVPGATGRATTIHCTRCDAAQ